MFSLHVNIFNIYQYRELLSTYNILISKIKTIKQEGLTMRLTVKTDYCLRVLIYLQTNKSKVKIQQIADDYEISKNHLSVAVNALSELGYVLSSPGPKGGIEFNKAFAEKTVAELVSKIEDLNIVECQGPNNKCLLNPQCKLKKMLTKARDAFVDELKNYKIKDLA